MHLARPNPAAPYRWLFLDVNAYFASVEQQDRPELRGKPVGVVPMLADSTCLIAASYEAKAFGLKTGMKVAEAKLRCPEIILVEGRHQLYADYHKKIVEAVESVVPVDKVCSVDEMRVRLLETEATHNAAVGVAMRIKNAIRDKVGESIKCSIGLASNPFLAKVASDIQKPDGLVVLHPWSLKDRLAELSVTDFAGINRRMQVRLNLAGIYTAKEMLDASEADLRTAFGSVVGARWWYLLKGYDLPEEAENRRSLGNSHVLPPDFRSKDGAYQVMLRLIQKSTSRLRRESLMARSVTLFARAKGKRWFHQSRLEPTYETLAIVELFQKAWQTCDLETPDQVAVTFGDLIEAGQMTLSIFDQDNSRRQLARTVDTINDKFGKNAILPAGLLKAKETAEERIAFRKLELFQEGGTRQRTA